jgi:probable F420-dependent oxidoreductase
VLVDAGGGFVTGVGLAAAPVDEVAAMAKRIGPVGVFSPQFMAAPLSLEPAGARRVEALGYGSLWSGEIVGGKEAFGHSSVLLAATSTLVYGTGIANLWSREAATMQAGAATVGAAWPGRFVLGVGVSHELLVNQENRVWVRPLDRTAKYLEAMDGAAAHAPECPSRVPRLLAALGPRMLELARRAADGVISYFVPPEHTSIARAALGDDKLLVVEQAAVLCTDAAEARRRARSHTSNYLRKYPNYVNNLRRLGYDDRDFADGGSDRLVDALVVWGDQAVIAARVSDLRARGADSVALQLIASSLADELDQLATLAPAVLPQDQPVGNEEKL